jgi:hypothetical protein
LPPLRAVFPGHQSSGGLLVLPITSFSQLWQCQSQTIPRIQYADNNDHTPSSSALDPPPPTRGQTSPFGWLSVQPMALLLGAVMDLCSALFFDVSTTTAAAAAWLAARLEQQNNTRSALDPPPPPRGQTRPFGWFLVLPMAILLRAVTGLCSALSSTLVPPPQLLLG